MTARCNMFSFIPFVAFLEAPADKDVKGIDGRPVDVVKEGYEYDKLRQLLFDPSKKFGKEYMKAMKALDHPFSKLASQKSSGKVKILNFLVSREQIVGESQEIPSDKNFYRETWPPYESNNESVFRAKVYKPNPRRELQIFDICEPFQTFFYGREHRNYCTKNLFPFTKDKDMKNIFAIVSERSDVYMNRFVLIQTKFGPKVFKLRNMQDVESWLKKYSLGLVDAETGLSVESQSSQDPSVLKSKKKGLLNGEATNTKKMKEKLWFRILNKEFEEVMIEYERQYSNFDGKKKKFGILFGEEGQHTEMEMMRNKMKSSYNSLLNLLGTEVDLKGFQWKADLQEKDRAIFTEWYFNFSSFFPPILNHK